MMIEGCELILCFVSRRRRYNTVLMIYVYRPGRLPHGNPGMVPSVRDGGVLRCRRRRRLIGGHRNPCHRVVVSCRSATCACDPPSPPTAITAAVTSAQPITVLHPWGHGGDGHVFLRQSVDSHGGQDVGALRQQQQQ